MVWPIAAWHGLLRRLVTQQGCALRVDGSTDAPPTLFSFRA
jgi:hypothetical protein